MRALRWILFQYYCCQKNKREYLDTEIDMHMRETKEKTKGEYLVKIKAEIGLMLPQTKGY